MCWPGGGAGVGGSAGIVSQHDAQTLPEMLAMAYDSKDR